MNKGVSSLTTIYIVRHGQSEYNAQKRMAGHADTPLTNHGEIQAQQLAQELVHIHFDAVFSSDLIRAKRTAEIIALEKKLAVKTTEWLREQHFGRFEGASYEEFNTAFRKLLTNYENATDESKFDFRLTPDIETDGESVTRFITFLREIAIGYLGKTVLIVAHGSIMRYFLIRLGLATYKTLKPGGISNTSFIKFESDGVDFFVKETKGISKISIN